MDRLKADPAATAALKGKLVFFRPWPTRLGEAQSFDDQARLFSAVVERDVLIPPAESGQKMRWGLLWALAVLGLAFAPLWGALLAWSALPVLAVWDFSQLPQAVAQPLVLAVSALLLGLGWRLQRARRRRLEADRMLAGKVAAGHRVAWSRLLRRGGASLPCTYALLGPREQLQGPAWEAWMERWGAFLDHGSMESGQGIVMAGPNSKKTMAKAIFDLKQSFGTLSVALSCGTLSFRGGRSLGAVAWMVQGPCKDRAGDLFPEVRSGEILLSNNDFKDFTGIFSCHEVQGHFCVDGLIP
jgi:hypothetical protein